MNYNLKIKKLEPDMTLSCQTLHFRLVQIEFRPAQRDEKALRRTLRLRVHAQDGGVLRQGATRRGGAAQAVLRRGDDGGSPRAHGGDLFGVAAKNMQNMPKKRQKRAFSGKNFG